MKPTCKRHSGQKASTQWLKFHQRTEDEQTLSTSWIGLVQEEIQPSRKKY